MNAQRPPEPARPYREDLATIHDSGFDRPAREAAAVLLGALLRANIERGTIVDLGCGSGTLARILVDGGFSVHGLDLSAAMVSLARRRVPSGAFEVGSFLTARIPRCVAVTAIGEVLNYRFDSRNTEPARRRLFRRIHEALHPGGLLLLDAAEPGRVPGGGPLRTHFESEDWAVLVEASEDRANSSLSRRITTFRRVGDLYRRDQETHVLRLIPRAALTSELRATGFRVRTIRRYGCFRFPPGWYGLMARKP